ncbi:MAG: hypothetical protein HZB42_06190 [Sphingobacteriales bacterium]|jgi:hypothetical protein|nr:hypothetical protein [Sphingobacteriales bacterium]
MGHIKEPKGVDFIIKSKPLTDKERKEISEYIRQYKAKQKLKSGFRKRRGSSSKKKSLA